MVLSYVFQGMRLFCLHQPPRSQKPKKNPTIANPRFMLNIATPRSDRWSVSRFTPFDLGDFGPPLTSTTWMSVQDGRGWINGDRINGLVMTYLCMGYIGPPILNIQTSNGASKYGVFFFREIEGPHGAKGLLFLVGVFFCCKDHCLRKGL